MHLRRVPLSIALLATGLAMPAATAGSGPGVAVHVATPAPAVHGASGVPAPVTASSGIVPPSNPPQNIPPSPNFLNSCSGSSYDNSQACTNAALQAIDNGRAHEGLGPMALPSTWYSLSPQQQVFVATDIERADRGLPVLSAAATGLDQSSAQAAQAAQDPSPPSGFPWTQWGGNWAGAVGNALEAIYFWMYDDGLGSNNIDCTPSNTSGCWGHRDNVLLGMRCQPCLMGTGFAAGGYQGYPSWTELLVDSYGSPALDYTYAQVTGQGGGSGGAPAGTGFRAPSVAVGSSGLPTLAVQGSGQSLWLYWEQSNAQWVGPLGVGAPGSTLSAPAIAVGPSGLPTVAVQGPDDSLWLYWETPQATWVGPLGVGANGSTMSAPSVAVGPSGLPTVAVQAPGNGLWLYWETSRASWVGPLGVGTNGSTFASPAVAVGPSGLPTVAVQAPGNGLWLYWETPQASWVGPLGVGGSGSTYGAPSIAVGPSGLPTVAVDPSGSNWVYWEQPNATWVGPLGMNG